MSGPPEPEPRRGLFDPPRWMDGMAIVFSSGLFALTGVLMGISAFIGLVLLAVGIVPAGVGIPWILVGGALAPLFLFLHLRAERYAGMPGGASSPSYLSVAPNRRRSWAVRLFCGEERGSLARDGECLILRTRFQRQWPFFVAYLPVYFADRTERWMIAAFYGVFVADMILYKAIRRVERFPRERIASTLLCGNHVVLFLKGTPAPEVLVLRTEGFQRARTTTLLSPLAPFEELPAPRPPRAPRTPRMPGPPRPAPTPSTAIDAAKEKELDRALDGLKKSKP